MKLTVLSSRDLLRFVIEEDEPWNSSTFFPQLDSMFRTVRAAYDEARRPMVFDLSKLERVDSSMVALLVQTIRFAGDAPMAVIAGDPDIVELLRLMGLDKLMTIYTTVTEWEAARNTEPSQRRTQNGDRS